MFPCYVKVGICVLTGSQPRWTRAEGSASLLWDVVSRSVLFSESSALTQIFPRRACPCGRGGGRWASPWDLGGDLAPGSILRVFAVLFRSRSVHA